ncbi:MAG: carbohydrate porin [Vulcanimicrobiaceae bacterium]
MTKRRSKATKLCAKRFTASLRHAPAVFALPLALGTSLALCSAAAFAQQPDAAPSAMDSPAVANPSATASPAANSSATASPAPTATPIHFGRFTPFLNYTGEAATNPAGGLKYGAAYAGQLLMGFDLHLESPNTPGTSTIHFVVTNRHGGNLVGTSIGSNTSVQEIYGTQNTHLALFTYERKTDRLDYEFGRIPANISFLNSPLYCNFQSNSACGNPTFVFKDSNFTYWPASSWGGHVRAWFSPVMYLHVGAYEVNPDRKTPQDNGFDWNLTNSNGAVVPFELGYSTSFANDNKPRDYQIGGWYDEGLYSDPELDVNGNIFNLTGLAPATHRGRSGGFIRFDQTLLRPDLNSQRNLALFGVGMFAVSGRVTEDHYVELGVVQTGTFRGRDQDTLGFVINDQHFTNYALDAIRFPRVSAGASPNIPSHETMMELAYGAQLTPAIRISPNLQYILFPDQMAEPFRTTNIPSAFIIGFKFTFDVPTLLQQYSKP